MASVRTPNYRTSVNLTINIGPHGSQPLPAGSYVRPIEIQYVPQHVIDRNSAIDPTTHVFAYCKYGFFIVRRDFLEET